MTALGFDDSQKLFSLYAFHNKEPYENLKALVNEVSRVCNGIPLALKVVGSSLFDKTSLEDQEYIWKDAIDSLKGNHDITNALR